MGGSQELPGLILQSMIDETYTIKTRWTGIPAQQARDIAAPWTDTLVYDSYDVLLRSR